MCNIFPLSDGDVSEKSSRIFSRIERCSVSRRDLVSLCENDPAIGLHMTHFLAIAGLIRGSYAAFLILNDECLAF
jgi:hypothetical protein